MAAVSEEAKARRKQYQHDRYRWYVEHGICARCYKTWSEPGRIYCANCQNKIRAYTRQTDPDGSLSRARCQARRDRLKAAGLCVNCGKRKPIENKCLCATCAKKFNESHLKHRIHKRLSKGELT